MTHSSDINWQEAVARLAHERTLAESAVRILKKYGDADAVSRGSLAYSEAKAEYDGILAGLIVALARNKEPESLSSLEARLQHGFEKRQKFCDIVLQIMPASLGQKKGGIEEIVKGAVGALVAPLVEAIKAIWLQSKDDSALVRKTIETQLKATEWAIFALVLPEA